MGVRRSPAPHAFTVPRRADVSGGSYPAPCAQSLNRSRSSSGRAINAVAARLGRTVELQWHSPLPTSHAQFFTIVCIQFVFEDIALVIVYFWLRLFFLLNTISSCACITFMCIRYAQTQLFRNIAVGSSSGPQLRCCSRRGISPAGRIHCTGTDREPMPFNFDPRRTGRCRSERAVRSVRWRRLGQTQATYPSPRRTGCRPERRRHSASRGEASPQTSRRPRASQRASAADAGGVWIGTSRCASDVFVAPEPAVHSGAPRPRRDRALPAVRANGRWSSATATNAARVAAAARLSAARRPAVHTATACAAPTPARAAVTSNAARRSAAVTTAARLSASTATGAAAPRTRAFELCADGRRPSGRLADQGASETNSRQLLRSRLRPRHPLRNGLLALLLAGVPK